MLITATELKTNIGQYLDTVSREDIFISRKGKIIAKITDPARDKVALLDSLVGIAENVTLSAAQARAERLADA
ncbi:MAG: type II toxin-antitoxin system prevent-host-death family antitoxin [Propionibacteriaceae bacterium]|nr:type II toxin-antitoxin system prevent-host-death family antitoxin [Propionibacteriaceae bacterium]